MRPASLRLRLALAGALAVLLALGLAALGLGALFGEHVERRAVTELSAHLDQVLSGLDRSGGFLGVVDDPADPRFDTPYGGLYWQVETGDARLRSRSLWDGVLETGERPSGTREITILAGPADQQLLALTRQAGLPERLGGQTVLVTVAMDRGELIAARRAFLWDLLPYLLLLAAFLSLAGLAQLIVGLRPLHHLQRRVAEVRHGRARRLGAIWPREVRPLTEELDALLDAREAEQAKAEARAGDLAHGLKTPLQALLGEASRLRRGAAPASADAIEQIIGSVQRRIDRELVRARAAARAQRARADVTQVVSRVVAVVQRTPDGAPLDWQVDIPSETFVGLDEADLAEALGALVENAARHAPGQIAITACREDQTLEIAIEDDGPGMEVSGEDHDRGSGSGEEGAGFGLAIAQDIATAAGGELDLVNTYQGFRACLRLPRSRAGAKYGDTDRV